MSILSQRDKPDGYIVTAQGHMFDDDLTCHYCGTHYNQHQIEDKPCPNPKPRKKEASGGTLPGATTQDPPTSDE